MQDAKQLLHQPAENTRQLLKNTLGMAWPAVLESFFIALAGMIDVKMVSNLGSYAVAAVGLTTQPKFLGLAFFIATNVALSALVARRFGEKRREDANQVMITALVMSILVCAVISTLCVTLANPIINLCGSQPDTHAAAVTYFRIIMGGIIFSVISMTINAALRGSGNTRIAMTTNVTSSVLNICGNYLLIEGHFGFPALGIAGAAIVILSALVLLWYRRHCYRLWHGSGLRHEHLLPAPSRRICQPATHLQDQDPSSLEICPRAVPPVR